MTTGMQVVRGHTEAELDEIGKRLFRRRMAGQFYPQAWQLLGAHRAAGHTIVVASSASRFQIEAAASELGIEHILYTKLEVRDGRLTGGVDGKPLWGTGKADAVRGFADEHDIDLDNSYAYGNGGEDVAYLATVGNPVALNPGKKLTAAAEERGWPIMRFRSRDRIPGASQIARSALGATGFVTGAAAGFARGALGGSRRSDSRRNDHHCCRIDALRCRGGRRCGRRRTRSGTPPGGVHLQPSEHPRSDHRREGSRRRLHRSRPARHGEESGPRPDPAARRGEFRRRTGRRRRRSHLPSIRCGRGGRSSSHRRAPGH